MITVSEGELSVHTFGLQGFNENEVLALVFDTDASRSGISLLAVAPIPANKCLLVGLVFS